MSSAAQAKPKPPRDHAIHPSRSAGFAPQRPAERFLFPPSLRRRTRSGCCVSPLSQTPPVAVRLCGCAAMRHARRLVLPLSFRTVSRRTTSTTSSFPDPIAATGHNLTTPHTPATPSPYLSTSHPPSRTQKRDGEAETPPSPNCVCSCSTPYRSACHHKVISIPG